MFWLRPLTAVLLAIPGLVTGGLDVLRKEKAAWDFSPAAVQVIPVARSPVLSQFTGTIIILFVVFLQQQNETAT